MNLNYKKGETTLKVIFHILVKNKLWFLIAFLIVFTGGLIFSLVSTYPHSIDASIKLTDNYKYYDDFLLENFPEKTENLWLYKESEIKDKEIKILDSMQSEILSDNFLKELKRQLSFDISLEKLKKSIYSFRENSRNLTIKIVYNDPEKTFEIANELTKLLKFNKKSELYSVYNLLLGEMNKKIEEVSTEFETEDSEIDNKGLDSNHKFYNDLTNAKTILLENKEYFVNRISLVEEKQISDVYKYTSKSKNIIFSLILGVFLALIVTYSRYFYKCIKNN
ncbi:MAG: hypothetical protein E3J83_01255 [Candidatus Atribacteria bacterium]|nr:MAG: hypothetical protein E3J83_01255 [Candidatus Atribacteria bacterium]